MLPRKSVLGVEDRVCSGTSHWAAVNCCLRGCDHSSPSRFSTARRVCSVHKQSRAAATQPWPRCVPTCAAAPWEEQVATVTKDAAALREMAITPAGGTALASLLPSPAAALIPSPVCPFCKVLSDPVLFSLHFVHMGGKPLSRSGCKMVLVTVTV